MEIESALRAAGAAFAVALAAPAAAHDRGETVTPHFERAIPNIPGKSLVVLVVDYAPVAPRCRIRTVMQSSLPAALVELVYLRVSQINNCAYCLDMHTRDLLKKGQKIEKLALVQAWAEAGNLFDERERAALAWTETVTCVAETDVPDKAYEAARAVFDERELVDLTIAISLMNAYNRIAISFRATPLAATSAAAA